MPVEYATDPLRFRGSGTVFIVREAGVVRGYWDALPEADPAPLEKLPAGMTVVEAAQWGAERTPRVLIRTGQRGPSALPVLYRRIPNCGLLSGTNGGCPTFAGFTTDHRRPATVLAPQEPEPNLRAG